VFSKKSVFRSIAGSIWALPMLLVAYPVSAADQAPNTHYEMPMSKAAFFSDLGKKVNSEYNQLFHLLLDREMIEDPQQRKARLEVVKPLLLQYQSDIKALSVSFPADKNVALVAQGVDAETIQRLALLGDEDAIKQLNADAAGSDVDKSILAQSLILQNQWTMAGGRIEGETQVADALDKLDHAHPESQELTAVTMRMSGEANNPNIHERLLELAVGMSNPVADKMTEIKKIMAAKKAIAKNVGQPFVLTGKTSDGKDFSTADWKGKVILVDFWATWCGPCKQELPNIQKLYADYHDKGFEIVSVSNDFDLKALATYTAQNHMPWPQLVNADAVAKHSWNPMTLGYGIDGIPRIFVIDRHGVLLDDHANLTYKDLVEKALVEKPQTAALPDHALMPQ
jgi:thiol-disulfide isomerase/thioredoxin